MNESGFVQISRDFSSDDFYLREKFDKPRALYDLMNLAAYKPRTIKVGNKSVTLKPGEVAVSKRFLAPRWHWAEGTVVSFIEWLVSEGYFEVVTTKPTKILAVKKYLIFDPLKNPINKGESGNNQSIIDPTIDPVIDPVTDPVIDPIRIKYNKERTKKDKENNSLSMREREENSLSFSKPTLEDVENYLRENNIASFAAKEFWLHCESVGWKSKGNRITNWQALCDYWDIQRQKSNPKGKQTQDVLNHDESTDYLDGYNK